MAPANILAAALAAVARVANDAASNAAAVPPTYKSTSAVTRTAVSTTTRITATTTDFFTQTYVRTLVATIATATPTTRTATPTAWTTTATSTSSATCWPGTCSPDIAVSFGRFPDTGDSRFVSTWGGAAFAGVFGLVTIVHLVQGCYYRWKVSAVAVAGGLAAFAGYTLQATGSRQQPDETDEAQPYLLASAFVLLQIAPLCITLFPYLTLRRLVRTRFVPAHDSLPDTLRRPWPSNGRWVAQWPVWVLLATAAAAQAIAVAFLVYCGLTTVSIIHTLIIVADLVWAGGLAAQGLMVLVLMAAVTQAYSTLPPARPGGQQERSEAGTVRPSLPPRRRVQLVWLLWTMYGVLAMLMMRIVFRAVVAVTASEGAYLSSKSSSAATRQVYALLLDALPTFLALVLLCACHAGWALPATEARHQMSPESGGGAADVRGEAEEVVEVRDHDSGGDDLESPLERRVYFGQQLGQVPALIAERIRIQQRAALQRQRQGPPPVVEALARFSLSASLSVSLPRESFMIERPAADDIEEAMEGPEEGQPTRGLRALAQQNPPQRLLARLSMENFMLFRFLNTPSRSTRGGHSTPSAPSAPSAPSHSAYSGADDPFADFDAVADAGLRRTATRDTTDIDNNNNNENDSRRIFDSPDEKRGPPSE